MSRPSRASSTPARSSLAVSAPRRTRSAPSRLTNRRTYGRCAAATPTRPDARSPTGTGATRNGARSASSRAPLTRSSAASWQAASRSSTAGSTRSRSPGRIRQRRESSSTFARKTAPRPGRHTSSPASSDAPATSTRPSWFTSARRSATGGCFCAAAVVPVAATSRATVATAVRRSTRTLGVSGMTESPRADEGPVREDVRRPCSPAPASRTSCCAPRCRLHRWIYRAALPPSRGHDGESVLRGLGRASPGRTRQALTPPKTEYGIKGWETG